MIMQLLGYKNGKSRISRYCVIRQRAFILNIHLMYQTPEYENIKTS
jgi:hypothetical protein